MPLTILQRIEKVELQLSYMVMYNLEVSGLNINDENGFEIVGTQINYYDTSNEISATYNLFDNQNNPTDTYIVKKVLVSKKETQIAFTLDRTGGSEIVDNQQIYYDSDGVESARYNLFDKDGLSTSSSIFKKVRVV